MTFPDRVLLKARAKERVLDQSFGVLMVSIFYLILTDWISTLANLIATNPVNAIGDQFNSSFYSLLERAAAEGKDLAGVDPSPIYSSTFAFARDLLSQPGQQMILFFFLLFYLYSVVLSYGYSFYALRVSRGERLKGRSLFDPLWLSGKIILLSLITSILVGFGCMFFLIPGIFFYYSYLLAPYVLMDHPEMSVIRALSASARMTRGHRMQLIALDLSFLGWMLLGYVVMDLGYNVGELFYNAVLGALLSTLLYTVVYAFVLPYRELSLANFYDIIRPQDLKVENKPL